MHRVARRAGLSLFLPLLLLVPASRPRAAAQSSPLEESRARILAIAESYAKHEWRATEKNVLHGADPDGVRVDTPDASHDPKGWKPGEGKNVGVPYQWGGFSSLAEFDRGVADGKLAGHVPSTRAADMSRHAVGVDCSGLVSLAWSLPRKYSTRSLSDLCYRLDSVADLLPGDVLNAFNGHVVIVKEFTDETKSRVRAYEAAIPSVVESEHDVAALVAQGYVPLRYKPLDPRFAADAAAFRDPPRDRERGRFEPATGTEPLAGEAAKAFVLALPGPYAEARRGDWVALRRHSTRSEGGGREYAESGLLLRGVSRRDVDALVTLHERTEIGGKRLDTLETTAAEATLVGALVREIGGERAAAAPVELASASVRKGRFVLGDATFAAEEIACTFSVRFDSAGLPLVFRVALSGIRSNAIPLGGFLESKLEIRVEDGARVVEIASEERLADWERGSA